MKRRIIFNGLIALISMSLLSCSQSTNQESPSEDSHSQVTPEPEDTTDYGKVSFKPIYIYCDSVGNNFDEVPITPIFTNPEVCQNEVFEYEIRDESFCYIENDCVYATGVNGSTRVIAKSQHLKSSFNVYSSNKFNNNDAFSVAKSLANTASKATNQGTTLFVGASTFQFWRAKHNIDEDFQTAFAGYDVANVGISGTQAREWRSLRKSLIDPYEPENIVMHLGLNDIDDNNEDGEDTANHVMTLCEDIWDKLPNCNIYCCSLVRCTGTFASKWTYHNEFNEIMENNAKNTAKLHYLDIMGIFGDDYNNYHQPDGLHLNTAAYEIIKNLIKETVPLKAL